MEKAMIARDILSQNDRTRLLYQARQMALHNDAPAIAAAKDQPREEGIPHQAVKIPHTLLLAKTASSKTRALARRGPPSMRQCRFIDTHGADLT